MTKAEQQAVITKHLPLVRHLVSELIGRRPDYARFRADLVQDGTLALYHALTKFDPNRGVAFGTYAWAWVQRDVREAACRYSSPASGVRTTNKVHAYHAPTRREAFDVAYEGTGTFGVRNESDAIPDSAGSNELTMQRNLEARRLSKEVFHELAGARRKNPKRDVEIFFRAYVQGESIADVARDMGLSRQRTHTIGTEVNTHFQAKAKKIRGRH